MSYKPLPDSWDDEPFELDEPDFGPLLNVRTRTSEWFDGDPPQVSDVADEAWDYAIDHGIGIEQAMVELQRRKVNPPTRDATGPWQWGSGNISGNIKVSIGGIDLTSSLHLVKGDDITISPFTFTGTTDPDDDGVTVAPTSDTYDMWGFTCSCGYTATATAPSLLPDECPGCGES